MCPRGKHYISQLPLQLHVAIWQNSGQWDIGRRIRCGSPEDLIKGDTSSEWYVCYPSPLSPSGCLEFRHDSWSSSSHFGPRGVFGDGSCVVKMAEQKDGRHMVPGDFVEKPHQSLTTSSQAACTWQNEPQMIRLLLFWSQMQFLTATKRSSKEGETTACPEPWRWL